MAETPSEADDGGRFLREMIQRAIAEALAKGAGNGTSGSVTIEQRVAFLEADMKEVKADLKALIREVAEIKGRIASMPNAWQLLGMNLAMVLTVMGATFALARFLSH